MRGPGTPGHDVTCSAANPTFAQANKRCPSTPPVLLTHPCPGKPDPEIDCRHHPASSGRRKQLAELVELVEVTAAGPAELRTHDETEAQFIRVARLHELA